MRHTARFGIAEHVVETLLLTVTRLTEHKKIQVYANHSTASVLK